MRYPNAVPSRGSAPDWRNSECMQTRTTTQAAHSALGTGGVTGCYTFRQVTGHWSDSRQAVTGLELELECFSYAVTGLALGTECQIYPRHSALNAVQKLVTCPRSTSFLHSNGSKNAFRLFLDALLCYRRVYCSSEINPAAWHLSKSTFQTIFHRYVRGTLGTGHWSAECNLDTGLALGTECFA